MLRWAIIFLVVALVAAILRFWWHCRYRRRNREDFVLPLPRTLCACFDIWTGDFLPSSLMKFSAEW